MVGVGFSGVPLNIWLFQFLAVIEILKSARSLIIFKMNELIIQEKYKIAKKQLDELTQWKNISGLSFFKIGKILKKIKEEKLYQHLGDSPEYETFEMFLQSPEVNIASRRAYQLIQVYDTYIEKLKFKPEKLLDVSWTSLRVILPIITPENCKDLVRKARLLRRGDLEIEVKQMKKGINTFSDSLYCKHKNIKRICFFQCTDCGERFKLHPNEKHKKIVKPIRKTNI